MIEENPHNIMIFYIFYKDKGLIVLTLADKQTNNVKTYSYLVLIDVAKCVMLLSVVFNIIVSELNVRRIRRLL